MDYQPSTEQLLKNHINKVNENSMEFELVSVDKVVQPLDVLIRLKNNKSTGDVLIKMVNKDDDTLGIFKFKTFKVIKSHVFVFFMLAMNYLAIINDFRA